MTHNFTTLFQPVTHSCDDIDIIVLSSDPTNWVGLNTELLNCHTASSNDSADYLALNLCQFDSMRHRAKRTDHAFTLYHVVQASLTDVPEYQYPVWVQIPSLTLPVAGHLLADDPNDKTDNYLRQPTPPPTLLLCQSPFSNDTLSDNYTEDEDPPTEDYNESIDNDSANEFSTDSLSGYSSISTDSLPLCYPMPTSAGTSPSPIPVYDFHDTGILAESFSLPQELTNVPSCFSLIPLNVYTGIYDATNHVLHPPTHFSSFIAPHAQSTQHHPVPFMGTYPLLQISNALSKVNFVANKLTIFNIKELKSLAKARMLALRPPFIYYSRSVAYPLYVVRGTTSIRCLYWDFTRLRRLHTGILQLIHGVLTPAQSAECSKELIYVILVDGISTCPPSSAVQSSFK
ncbi:hypothetical protein PAXINDRAFT_12170 [Paxillus involutus ATCC 200175]|uniref:Uncharacterized protein n=1 Tax=Paxillus involutus ATCC 200175 TaxID=664439 RepID=A0A0C9SYA0_PAXIN|nr:hypothetical protein PAXINDRAFT_12170 [Paxillus involutus ATCC 200175]